METGRNKLSGALLIQFARGLGVSIDTLQGVRDGTVSIDDAVREARSAPRVPVVGPPANNPLALHEEAARRLEELHQEIGRDEAWLLIRALNFSTALDIYAEALKRWKAAHVDVKSDSLPPGKTPEDLRRKITRKGKR